MHKFKKVIGFTIVIAVVGFLIVFSTQTAKSSNTDNMSGFAWGAEAIESNGIPGIQLEEVGGLGWLSFNNCTSPGNCPGVGYGVTVDGDNYLQGYAWSSNYGWLKFGGFPASGFPVGSGTTSDNAKFNPSTNKFTGWARFCAVFQTGCSGDYYHGTDPVNNDINTNIYLGGWDGWVSLSGTGYGVEYDPVTHKLSEYAWGGNNGGKNIVGWINFDTGLGEVEFIPITVPTVQLTAVPQNILAGDTATLTWSGLNLDWNNPTGCIATGGTFAGTHPSPAQGGSLSFPVSPADDTTYSIKCLGTSGQYSEVVFVTVTVGVDLEFWPDSYTVYPPDYETVLHWAVVPPTGTLQNCTANSVPANGTSWPPNPVLDPPSSDVITVPGDSAVFNLTCYDTNGAPYTETLTINRGTLNETVHLNNESVICDPVTGGCTVELYWEVSNVHSCTAWTDPATPDTGWGPNITPDNDDGAENGILVPLTAPGFTYYWIQCLGDSENDEILDEVHLNENSNASQPPQFREN